MHKFFDKSGRADRPWRRRGCRPPSRSAASKFGPATVLAPMAGITDTVFRRFIRNLGGCGLMMTEFTSADGIIRRKDKKAKQYLTFYGNEHPISAQLFGSDPVTLAEAARFVEELGFDLVDLNLGCPAKKVVKCNGGSGLLRDLPLIENIFESMRAAVKIPFTVKFRAGWSDKEIVHVQLAKMAEECGLAARGSARAHSRAGLQRPRQLGLDRRGEGCGQDSGHRQRRRAHARGCRRHGGAYRMRCGDDRPQRCVESLDLPPDRAIHPHRQLRLPSDADRYEMIRTYFGMLLEEKVGGAEGKMKQFVSVVHPRRAARGATAQSRVRSRRPVRKSSPRWIASSTRC